MNIFVPDSLKESAKQVLLRNFRATGEKYICPSWPHYPHQWLWDSCFHAISASHFGLQNVAEQEIRRLLELQRPDGFIPHVRYLDRHFRFPFTDVERFLYRKWRFHSDHSQPPVLARALKAINDPAFTRETFKRVKDFFLYFIRFQDPDHDGLISCFIPTETGRDASPEFDRFYPRIKDLGPIGYFFNSVSYFGFLFRTEWKYRRMRWDIGRVSQSPVDIEDVMFNCIWVDGMYILASLCSSVEEREEIEKLARRTEDAIVAHCWDGEGQIFRCLAKDNSFIKTMTVSNLFPLLLPNLPRQYGEALVKHLVNPDKFWTPYPIPSVAADDVSFDPDRKERLIWRGPTWINTNWYLVLGLMRHGFDDIAKDLAQKTIKMVEKEGFW